MAHKNDWHADPLRPDTIITADFRTTQNVRRFFQSQLGEEIQFSREFRRWLRENTGKTLKEAITAYKAQSVE